ncbi:hypothetical protein [Catenulispora subtropica]|uniref:Uncharacterized protein n=1 Tax=Catenulispora subtropica TaxID=450798 RepID=A0ABP5F038_9ACTN
MTHVWITTADGDLLRADQIRQINVVEGLRVVTRSGSQFLVADVEGRQAALTAARELASAIAEADTWSWAAELDVVSDGTGWTVRAVPMREAGAAAEAGDG